MKMECPHCGVNGTVDNSLVGRNVRCPKCANAFVVNAKSSAPIEINAGDLEEYQDGGAVIEVEGTSDIDDDLDISDLLHSEEDQDGFPSQKCAACSKVVHPALMMEIDSKKYCAGCVPEQSLFDEEMDGSAGVDVEPSTLDISPSLSSENEDVSVAPTPEKKPGSGNLIIFLLLFLVIALACAAAVVFMDIKLI